MIPASRPLSILVLTALVGFAPACAPSRLFYLPNRTLYGDPARAGIVYETVTFPSLNGKMLYAIIFRAPGIPKGTVVHFHGNFGNLSNHFPLSRFLTDYGFDVMVFDYQGYGASEGRPTPRHTVEDGVAAVRYAAANSRNPKAGVAVFGQSLGGAVATVVAARETWLQAAVIEASFDSYRGIGRDVLKRSAWTWILSPVLPLFLSDRYAPERYISRIAPRPLLLIHGDRDKVIPLRMSKHLYAAAGEPKELWVMHGPGHTEGRAVLGKVYEEKMAAFLEAAFAAGENTR